MRKRFGIALGVVAAGVLALGAQSAAAATIKVTNTNDFGAGSLRKAIASANQLPGFDRIVIEATGTIGPAGQALPAIVSDLAVVGPGARQLVVDGTGLRNPTFQVGKDRLAKYVVTLNGLSIVGGGCCGIYNYGTLTLSHSTVRDTEGDGIGNGGNATVTDSVVVDNRDAGISNYGGRLTVLHSLVARNVVGIYEGKNQETPTQTPCPPPPSSARAP